jgi:hypothetical protein
VLARLSTVVTETVRADAGMVKVALPDDRRGAWRAIDLSQWIAPGAPSKISLRCSMVGIDAVCALMMCPVQANRAPGNAGGNDERRQRSSLHVPRMWTSGNTARIRRANQRRRIRIKVQAWAESQSMPEPQRSGVYCSPICCYSRALILLLANDQGGATEVRVSCSHKSTLLASARLDPLGPHQNRFLN